MGSVRRAPDGRPGWQARYRGPDGQQHTATFPTKSDARAHLEIVGADVQRGVWVDPMAGRLTFAEWVEQYRQLTSKRPTTAARDEAVLRRWLLPELGRMRLSAITPSTVRGLVAKMGEPLAPATVRTNYGVLRAILNAAVEADLIGRTPCRGVRVPDLRRHEPRFLSAEELHALADAMPVDYQPMIYVAGVLGLRWSEVAGLRVGRVDFLRRTVTVAETLAEVNGRPHVADVKTKAARRTLGMPAELAELLAAHLSRVVAAQTQTSTSSWPPTVVRCGPATSANGCGSRPSLERGSTG